MANKDERERADGTDLIREGLALGDAFVDDKKVTWNKLCEQILSKKGKIIALIGAGSINGADKKEADRLLEGNPGKLSKIREKINQRRNIYGAHWDNQGNPSEDQSRFPNLEFSFVSLN